jgi:hypothetical protein
MKTKLIAVLQASALAGMLVASGCRSRPRPFEDVVRESQRQPVQAEPVATAPPATTGPEMHVEDQDLATPILPPPSSPMTMAEPDAVPATLPATRPASARVAPATMPATVPTAAPAIAPATPPMAAAEPADVEPQADIGVVETPEGRQVPVQERSPLIELATEPPPVIPTRIQLIVGERGLVQRPWPAVAFSRPSGDVMAGPTYWPSVDDAFERSNGLNLVMEPVEFLLNTVLLPVRAVITPPWTAMIYSPVGPVGGSVLESVQPWLATPETANATGSR